MSTKPKITAKEIARAIFIDYEGNIGAEPTLLGWRVDGTTHAAILKESFATCSNRFRAKGIEYTAHASLAQSLVDQACKEDRVIVSWSEHDWRLISVVLPEEKQDQLSFQYRNAITTARSWHYRALNQRAPVGDLSYFTKLLGFHVPQKYGQGKVGQGLRLIRAQLNEGRQYAQLTPKARSSWVAVVKHNSLDLEAMEFVLKSMLQVPLKGNHPDQMALTFIQADS
jgi:hypothetical protein